MIEHQVDSELGLSTYRVVGATEGVQLAEAIAAFWEAPTRLVLWDLRDAVLTAIATPDIEALAEIVAQYGKADDSVRTALVFSPEVGKRLGMIFQSFSKEQENPQAFRSFASLESAYAWLRDGDTRR